MLFCNFLRINSQLVVQKLIGHNTSFHNLRFHFAGGAKTAPNSEKKYNRQLKHRTAVNKPFEIVTLIEHTARFFGSL